MTRVEAAVRIALAIGIALAAESPQAARSQAAPDEWQFRATIYGWFPGLEGTTEFPSGAGGSRFTWQTVLGLGHSFGWGDDVAAWRYTDYEFKSGEPVQSLTLQGPALGASFRF
jgi:hypothetical protein